ncbi:hypothetical protein [Actinomadura oligospora]|uniref:hypothetical protein n=1 Tax=Actinomadura oligospora TaxID=111804 RepID=UPI0006847A53|nr:hypothetical protein [Actinomadura oligospora]
MTGSGDQQSLFFDPEAVPSKPPGQLPVDMRVLITVKAAPNPSQSYGETVCVAGIRIDEPQVSWVRLYPINFRALADDKQFRKYDVVRLRARPSSKDPRPESFRPDLGTVRTEERLKAWPARRRFVVDLVNKSMCQVLQDVRDGRQDAVASLAAIRPRQVDKVVIKPHLGWNRDEQAKIDAYMQQQTLDETGPRTALKAPAFRGWYRYRCQAPDCRGHEQGIYDWEFVALQWRLRRDGHSDAEIEAELRTKFEKMMCGTDRDTIFYVGNQQKHRQTFMVLGVFYPPC